MRSSTPRSWLSFLLPMFPCWDGLALLSFFRAEINGRTGGSIYPLFSFACIGFGVVCFICFGIEDTDMSGGVNCSYIGL
jgi:hypothetical protein